jgi:hypothetical protein
MIYLGLSAHSISNKFKNGENKMKRILFLGIIIISMCVSLAAGSFQDIAYVSNRSGHWEIWKTSSTDPGNSTQLTWYNGSGNPFMPRWSPKGNLLAFVMSDDIYVMASDGSSQPVRLTYDAGYNYLYNADFGEDEEWVYYLIAWPASHTEVWRVNVNTMEQQPVNQRPNTNFHNFDVSIDGHYRVEVRENGCCWTPRMNTVVYDLLNHTETTIFGSDGNAEWMPRFNKEGDQIVYSRASAYRVPYSLWVANTDGGNNRQITFPSGGTTHWNPVWSRDSRQILYQTDENGNKDLYLIDLDSSVNTPFIAGPYHEVHPDWYHGPVTVAADIDIDPDTLNLKSKGKWITAYISFPEDHDLDAVDIASVDLHFNDGIVNAKWGKVESSSLMVKFSRGQLIDLLGGTIGRVELTITGNIGDSDFEGTDVIKVK